MDRHEMRFIIRSGLYNECSNINKNDPLNKKDLQESLSNFSIKHLNGFIINGINLGKAPSIIDIFIWSFSAEDKYNMCS